ncbi:hypothetical protein [Streptomyces bauhiniae]
MQTFELPAGYSVETARVSGTANIEFVTRNGEGEAVSTVYHAFAEAAPLLENLRRADKRVRCLRAYGVGA